MSAALSICCLSACTRPSTPNWNKILHGCPTDEALGQLKVRDRIAIRVYGEEDMSGVYEVSTEGTIDFPLLNAVNVEGLRCDEISELLTWLLQERRFIRDPSITCLNEQIERSVVSVGGQVQLPGSVAFRTGLTLTDVIAQSKDLTLRADSGAVIVRRKSASMSSVVVPYDKILQGEAQDICLHPGDSVYVPEAMSF